MNQLSDAEKHKAEAFFQKNGISVDEIKSFCFMKDYYKSIWKTIETPILTLHLSSGEDKNCRLSNSQTAILRFLTAKQIPFSNYVPQKRSVETIPVCTYKSISTQLFDVLMVVITWLLAYIYFNGYIAGDYSKSIEYTLVYPSLLLASVLSLFTTYYFCRKLSYLRFDREALTIRTLTTDIEIPYNHIRKVTFKRSYSKSPRPFMDVIDYDYHYHTYCIGWVPFKRLNEITDLLKRLGIDATNNVNY